MLSHLKFELWRFFRGHWPHFLLAIPGAVFWTILHESAHALAVTLQGGQVLKFVWLPTMERWGYVQYSFPHQHFSAFAIAVAPYCFWLMLMLTAGGLSLRTRPYPPWLASTIFFWMFAMPLGDIALPALPYLFGSVNDFTYVFGPSTRLASMLILLFGIVSAAFGWITQQRLYREQALSSIGYVLLAMIGFVLMVALYLIKTYWR